MICMKITKNYVLCFRIVLHLTESFKVWRDREIKIDKNLFLTMGPFANSSNV